MDVTERLRRGYHALGFGADGDALAMFDQSVDGDDVRWVVVDLVTSGRPAPSREVVAHDLLGSIPAHWEVVGVETDRWVRRGRSIVVTGHLRVRPRGGWDVVRLPFGHVWRVVGDHVESVRSYLDGIELRRASRSARAPSSSTT
jgi:hypothetical protein